MKLITRIKNICLTPKTEWLAIEAEDSSFKALIIRYLLPLAALSAIAGLLGNSVIGRSLPFLGTYRIPFISGLGIAVSTLVMAVVAAFILSWVINSLASTFDGQKNSQQAFKLAIYAYTPAWLAGLLQILPGLGFLAILLSFYGFYLLYLGLPRLMKSPDDKSFVYTAVVVVSAVVLSALMHMSMAMFSGVSGLAKPAQTEVQFDPDSPMGKLQQFGQNMEEVSKKMEVAEKQGTPEQQMQIAMQSLGAVLGGGKKVEPIAIEQLKGFVPESFAGLLKKSNRAEKTGALGIKVSKVEATYADTNNATITLEISDQGGVGGLLSLASWVNVEDEKEDESGSEKSYKVDGRMTHEKSTKNGSNEFSVVVADRFMIKASGQGVNVNSLKNAVMALDLATLDALAKQH